MNVGGLLVFFLIGLYLWIALKVVRHITPVCGKTLAVLVFVLIPTADAVYGRINLTRMCETEGGLKIYRTIENVDGFYAPRFGYDNWIVAHGYKFVEGTDVGTIVRYSKDSNGKIVKEDINLSQLKSTYIFEYIEIDQGTFLTARYVVKNRQTNDVLGQLTDFAYYGGWAERALGRVYAHRGRVGHCDLGAPGKDMFALVATVLKPTK